MDSNQTSPFWIIGCQITTQHKQDQTEKSDTNRILRNINNLHTINVDFVGINAKLVRFVPFVLILFKVE